MQRGISVSDRAATPVARPSVVRAAVSTLSTPLLSGPPRPATVIAATRFGCYLHIAGRGQEILPVLTRDALVLPTALLIPAASADLHIRWEPDDDVIVGEGRLVGPGLIVEAVRSFRPSRVRRVPHPGLRNLAIARFPWRLDSIGLGPGLTPEADDELTGALLVGFAAGVPLPDLTAHLHRTTAISAALLRSAAKGYAVPAVARYVDALLEPRESAPPDHDSTIDALREQVAAIGHTSGPALLRGIHWAASLLTPDRINGKMVA